MTGLWSIGTMLSGAGGRHPRALRRQGDDFGAVAAMLIDPTVEAILMITDAYGLRQHGLPFPVFASLVLAGWDGERQDLASLLEMMKPHLRGDVTVGPDHGCREVAIATFGADRVSMTGSVAGMAEAIDRAMSG